MAICGRCWICGCKFSCSGYDEGPDVSFRSDREDDKICTACVRAIDGTLPTGPSEPHGDGEPEIDRLARLIGLLAHVADARAARGGKHDPALEGLIDHVVYCGHCSCNSDKRDRCEEYVRLRSIVDGGLR